MFSQLGLPKQAPEALEAAPASMNMLSFDPSTIVQAIAFHLLDEGKISAISRESSEAAVDKLSQQHRQLAISADQWVKMTNAQRLQWLLDRSHVVFKAGTSGTAVLMVRRWQPLIKWASWLWKWPVNESASGRQQ